MAPGCLLLSLLLHVYYKIVIAGNGEPCNQGEEALEAHFAISALVQVLHYFVHSQRVFLIFQKSRELLLHEHSQVLLCQVALIPSKFMKGEHHCFHGMFHLRWHFDEVC